MRVLIDVRARRRRGGVDLYAANLLDALDRVAPGTATPVRSRRRRAPSLPPADIAHGTNFVPLAHPSARKVATIHDLGYATLPGTHPPGWAAELDAAVAAAIPTTHAWICVSAHTRRAFLDRYGANPRICHVVPLGVAPRFSPGEPGLLPRALLARRGVRGPYVLHVGSLVPRKDVGTLLRAFAQLARQQPDLHLVLAGSKMRRWATDWWRVRSWLRSHPDLAPRVVALDHVPAAVLPGLYRGAAAVASTARLEGFGLAALEALACGTPVVATAGSGVEEWGGDAVAYAPAGDANAVARALRHALDGGGPDRARGLAVARRLTWDDTARATLAVYERVLAT